jgi:hypothetical protein
MSDNDPQLVQCPDCEKHYDQRAGHICPSGPPCDDEKLDDPRHGQARHINRERGEILFGLILFLAVLGAISLGRPACGCGDPLPPDPVIEQIGKVHVP